MKKVLLAFALMAGMVFAQPPHRKHVPPPPPPRFTSNYTFLTPSGNIELVRPRRPMFVMMPTVTTKVIACSKVTKKCDTYINPDYKLYYDELIVHLDGNSIVYDRGEYTVNISQSR